MRKTRQPLSLEPPIPFQPFASVLQEQAPFPAPYRLRRDQTGEHRKIPIEHFPSPRSPILFKIVAMETYSGNIPRQNRRRLFYNRFRSP
jgi:hypothetical protein